MIISRKATFMAMDFHPALRGYLHPTDYSPTWHVVQPYLSKMLMVKV